jgi:glycosyltransferase involved in cell wall biosynthesis
LFSNPFESIRLKDKSKIIFVADLFLENYVGGAELSSEALIESSNLEIQKIHSKDLTLDLLKQGLDKFWIFGNYSSIDPNLFQIISNNLKYSVIEYDYKFCKYRSIEKHILSEGKCNCSEEHIGRTVFNFLLNAKTRFWMSHNQFQKHLEFFPKLSERENVVLSSVFNDSFFENIENLNSFSSKKNNKWIILGSPSWIKGSSNAETWCIDSGKEYEIVWNLPYDQLLEKLAESEGFCFMPNGADTCPRIVIEAKLLGCELTLNNNVQHLHESWFNTGNLEEIKNYLRGRREIFWNHINDSINRSGKISSYVSAFNLKNSNYPWKSSIESLLGFSDEVVIVDGGSIDGSYEELQEWSKVDPRLKVASIPRDWKAEGAALFDGMQKAEARKLCTNEFCWQMDIDEVIHPRDYQKIRDLTRDFPKNVDILALPVVEFWGNKGKFRVDVNPWKWRMSRNLPHITHGLPASMRRIDENGVMRSLGSDGCDYIHTETFKQLPFGTFMTDKIESIRRSALSGDQQSLEQYESWINDLTNRSPTVFHYSWFDLSRKIRNYRDFWTNFWGNLYGQKSAGRNMFFNKEWSDVSEEEIDSMAERLEREMGGWIFHSPVDFSKPTPWVKINLPHPVENWR